MPPTIMVGTLSSGAVKKEGLSCDQSSKEILGGCLCEDERHGERLSGDDLHPLYRQDQPAVPRCTVLQNYYPHKTVPCQTGGLARE